VETGDVLYTLQNKQAIFGTNLCCCYEGVG